MNDGIFICMKKISAMIHNDFNTITSECLYIIFPYLLNRRIYYYLLIFYEFLTKLFINNINNMYKWKIRLRIYAIFFNVIYIV